MPTKPDLPTPPTENIPIWRQRKHLAMATRAVLAERFPKTFRPFAQPKLPLKVGIREDVIAACPDLDPGAIRMALNDYTKGGTYQRAVMVLGATRIDLAGKPAGEVDQRSAQWHALRFQRIQGAKAKYRHKRGT